MLSILSEAIHCGRAGLVADRLEAEQDAERQQQSS
jgi:hypothetical protein